MKRIYSQTVLKWAKRTGFVSGSLIFFIFAYLSFTGSIEILSVSDDMVCAGTELDPCYAYISFKALEDVYVYPVGYDPWGRSIGFDFTPSPSKVVLQRSWGKGWRTIDLSKTWSKKVKYAVKFSKGRTYNIRLVGFKDDPSETIKWGFGSDEFGKDVYVDPYWFGVGTSFSSLSKSPVGHWRLDNSSLNNGGSSNLVTGWTNSGSYPYSTFTTSGVDISSAIVLLGGEAVGYSNAVSMSGDEDVFVSFDITLDNFVMPDFIFASGPTGGVIHSFGSLSAGTNKLHFKNSGSSGNRYVWFYSPSGEDTDFSVSNFMMTYGTVADSSGGGNDGENFGAVLTADRKGQSAMAMSFDGVDDYVNIGDVLSAPSTITLSGWIKLNSTVEEPVIIKGMGATGNREYGLYVLSNKVYGVIADESLGDVDSISGDTDVGTNVWVHVAMTWDGSTIRVYRNSIEDGSVATSVGSGDIEDLSANLEIGRDATTDYFKGSISDVKIFDYALSASQVKSMYESYTPRGGFQTGDLLKGLVGWWELDNQSLKSSSITADATPYGHDGTITGATLVSDRHGQSGRAYSFDGINDLITVSYDQNLNFSTDITLSTWVNFRDLSNNNIILVKGDTWNVDWSIGYDSVFEGGTCNGDKGIQAVMLDSGQFEWCGQSDFIASNWYHVVYTYDGVVEKGYVDGVLVDSKTVTADILDTDGDLIIGYLSSASEYFNGSLDDIRVYDRALSASEIKQLYDSYKSGGFSPGSAVKGLVGHWKLNKESEKNFPYASFEGNDFINISDGSLNNRLSSGGSKSLSMWIKFNDGGASQGGSYENIFTTDSDYLYAGFSLIKWRDGDGYVRFTNGYGWQTSAPGGVWVGGANGILGEWHHWVGVHDSSDDRMTLYMDGEELYSRTDLSPSGASLDEVAIGKGQGWTFNGSLADVRVYNSTLSQADVQTLYNNMGENVVQDNLVLWMPFNDFDDYSGLGNDGVNSGSVLTVTTTSDSTPYGNDGVVSGTAYAFDRFGQSGEAMSFDGVDDCVLISLYSEATPSLTASLWFKINAINPNDYNILFQQSDSGSGTGRTLLGIEHPSGYLYTNIGNSMLSYDTSLNTGQWYYASVAFDGTNLKLYLNGVEVSSATDILESDDASLIIGCGKTLVAQHFNGSISDVRIYDRALSASEVMSLYEVSV